MRFCFCWRAVARHAGLILAIMSVASAASVTQSVTPRARSVVRADSQGRLVRAVVVSPRAIESKLQQTQSLVNPELAGISDMVEAAAQRYNVDPLLVHSLIQVESGYNPYALSPKGAQGLMQLMPDTARRFGVRNSFDVRENIEGGVRYLKYLSSLFPNDPRLAIAAYNAGEKAVWKYGNNVPPYRETEQYVSRVGNRYGQARRAAEKAKEEKKNVPIETAEVVPPSETQPVYAPVEAFVDAEGRLHMRTPSPSERNP